VLWRGYRGAREATRCAAEASVASPYVRTETEERTPANRGRTADAARRRQPETRRPDESRDRPDLAEAPTHSA
jgi:hypothetical protein